MPNWIWIRLLPAKWNLTPAAITAVPMFSCSSLRINSPARNICHNLFSSLYRITAVAFLHILLYNVLSFSIYPEFFIKTFQKMWHFCHQRETPFPWIHRHADSCTGICILRKFPAGRFIRYMIQEICWKVLRPVSAVSEPFLQNHRRQVLPAWCTKGRQYKKQGYKKEDRR